MSILYYKPQRVFLCSMVEITCMYKPHLSSSTPGCLSTKCLVYHLTPMGQFTLLHAVTLAYSELFFPRKKPSICLEYTNYVLIPLHHGYALKHEFYFQIVEFKYKFLPLLMCTSEIEILLLKDPQEAGH